MVIKSCFGDYLVSEAPSLDAALGSYANSSDIFAIADEALFTLPHASALAGLEHSSTIRVKASEEQKSYRQIEKVFDQLLQSGFRRGCGLVAIGGGIVQDIACFVASVLFRGVPWDLVPTTLLSQCDSCIGSKSSINVGKFKNQIGTFYPPRNVVIVNSVLETLSSDDIRSGLGEVIKLHLIAGGEDYQQMASKLSAGVPAVRDLPPLVTSSLSIKKRFIEEDEFDRGIRNLLNYGHTFGHAYESVTSYRIPHGIAVTLGVVSATFVSERLGLAPRGHFDRINELVRKFYSPYEKELAAGDVEAIVDAMRLDKKSSRTAVNCILTGGPGRMERVSLQPDTQLLPLLAELKRELLS